jgi:hypothetical protein
MQNGKELNLPACHNLPEAVVYRGAADIQDQEFNPNRISMISMKKKKTEIINGNVSDIEIQI